MKSPTIIALSIAMLASAVSPAWAGCVNNDDRGSPHADQNGATQLIVTQQASNTWTQWIWRGGDDGEVFNCPWNNGEANCPYSWGQSKSKTTSKGWSGGVGAGGGTNDWFKKVVGTLAGAFSYTYTRSWTTTQTFTAQVSVPKGMYAEPIIAQTRRWQGGYMRGGWMESSRKTIYHFSGRTVTEGGKEYCYNFDGGRQFGDWNTHVAEGSVYRTYHIHW